jgi:ribosomal protein S18 acetylase RimI-like enzyme
MKIKIYKSLAIILLLSFQSHASLLPEDFTSHQGHVITLSMAESTDSKVAEETGIILLKSFLSAYQAYTENDLKISYSTKEAWLKAAFGEEVQDFKNQETPIQLLVVQHKGKVVGGAFFEPDRTLENAIYIRQMGIDPDYARSRIGEKMINTIKANDPSIKAIVLVTRIVNKQAINFYEKLGFIKGSYTHPDYSPQTYVGYKKDY